MKKFVYIFVFYTIISSCDFFKKENDDEAVAKVNETYLYKQDLEGLVPIGANAQDSTAIITAYINRWARQLLLMEGARLNLSEVQQDEFERLIVQYKTDLYTKAYIEGLVRTNIDSTVVDEEVIVFYEENKESFKLNDNILKFRYLCVPQNTINLDTITKRFKRFQTKDKIYLDSIATQFKSYALNDSIWIKQSEVIAKILVINNENKNELLKKSNFIQLKDSINLYLMHVKDVRWQNNYAPLDYVKPSIEQIVINKRKLELIKQFENDITKDAIKNKQFQIYN